MKTLKNSISEWESRKQSKMVYEHYDQQIKNLNARVDELAKEIDSLRNEIKNKTVEKNLYNTSSTADENAEFFEWDSNYGQQGL